MTGTGYAIAYGFLGFGLLAAVSWVWHYARSSGPFRRTAVIAGSILFSIGWVSFSATSIAAMGGMGWLPSSFEWPVGKSSDFIRTSDGGYAVAHHSAGRVQVYDAQSRFIRGWQADTGGRVFTLTPLAEGGIEVHAARGNRVHDYDASGNEIPIGSLRPTGSPGVWPGTSSQLFGERWWLWTLEAPGHAGVVLFAGMVLVGLSARKQEPAKNAAETTSMGQANDGSRLSPRTPPPHPARTDSGKGG